MPSPDPRISVILPFHNAAPTLAQAVGSVRFQSCRGWELILIDDGSTDGSAVVAAGCAALDSRIRVLSPGRVGLVEALNLGCASANGEFLARMDADDLSLPLRFERQLQLLSSDAALAVCGTHVVDIPLFASAVVGEGRRRYSAWLNAISNREQLERDLFVECPLAHPTFMLRRRPFEVVGGYRDCGWPEDHDLLLRLWREGFGLGVVPGDALLEWRDSPARLSRTDSRYTPDAFRRCRMHHLLRSQLLPPGRPLLQWGAGEEGKSWLRTWPPHVRPRLVVDVDPRKTGKRIHDVTVIPPEELPPPGDALLVVAVGAPGARDLIRPWLNARGWTEMHNFTCVA